MAIFKKIAFIATKILIMLALKFYYDDRDGFTDIDTYIFDEIDIENFVSFNDMIKLNIISWDNDRFYTGDTVEVKQAINDIQELKIKKVKNFIESEKYYFLKFTGTTKTHTYSTIIIM